MNCKYCHYIFPIIICLSISSLSPVVFAAKNCNQRLSNPKLEFKGTEDYVVRGKKFTRYQLSLSNRDEFPEELFRKAPNLPPCGSNKNSSRTWVGINDTSRQIYGFCALSSSDQLDSLWFALPKGKKPPKTVRVVLNDRLCKQKYASNAVKVVPETGKTIPVNCKRGRSISDAIKDVREGQTIKLVTNCKIGSNGLPIVISQDNVILDGNGRTVTGNKKNDLLHITGNNVIVRNINFERGNNGIVISKGGRVILNKVKSIKNEKIGILIKDKSYVEISNSSSNFNKYFGFNVLGESQLVFKNSLSALSLNSKNSIFRNKFNRVKKSRTSFKSNVTTRAAIPISATPPECDIEALSNGDFVNSTIELGAAISMDTGSLLVRDCSLDLGRSILGYGLKMVNASNATFEGAIVNIHETTKGIDSGDNSTIILRSHNMKPSSLTVLSSVQGIFMDSGSFEVFSGSNVTVERNYIGVLNSGGNFNCNNGGVKIDFMGNIFDHFGVSMDSNCL